MTSTTQATALDTALHVVKHWPGAKVLPVTGKVPAYAEVPHGSKDATDDPATIVSWFAGTSYGVAVTGILAIDGDDLDATFRQFGDDLTVGVQIQGNPDRATFLFAQPDDPYGDGKHPGGEVKGSGYVVLPPSRHLSDDCRECPGEHPYRWLTGTGESPPELPALPVSIKDWLDANVRRKADHLQPSGEVPPLWLTHGVPCRTVVSQTDEAELLLARDDAAKHEVMTTAVLRLLRLGEQGHAGVSTAIITLHGLFTDACAKFPLRQGSPTREFHRSMLGAVTRIEADGLTAGDDYGCCSPELDATLDDRVFTATPLLSHVRTYANAVGVGPWSLLGSTLARCVAEVAPHVRLPAYVGGDASANLYVALVDQSGGGKSSSHKAAEAAFTGMAYARQVPNGTGEGLLATFLTKTPKADRDADATLPPWRLHDNPQVLMYVDEIGQLQVGSSRQGATIEPILRSMWNGEHVGTNNADVDRNRNLPAHAYRLALVAGVQPGLAGSLLNSQATTSGTAQRWIWLTTSDPFAPVVRPDRPEPWAWEAPPAVGTVLYVSYPEYVREEVEAARYRMLRGIGVTEDDRVKAHAMLTRMKVAAAVAMLHGTLDVDDLYWAISGDIMAKSDTSRAAVLHTLAAAKEREHQAKGRATADVEVGYEEARNERIARRLWLRVRDHADTHPDAGCVRKCFKPTLASRDREYRDGALDYAVGRGWLVSNEATTERFSLGTIRPVQ